MGTAAEDRQKAAELPEGDVVRILLEQHARIRELFPAITDSAGARKQELFDELRALLAVHETAEELVLRPMTSTSGEGAEAIAAARNEEEAAATEVLKELEEVDVGDPDFDVRLATLEHAVLQHAEAEEQEEFPIILQAYDAEVRRAMGLEVRAAEKVAPTHPHPSAAGSTAAQLVLGPFAAIKDRAKDAIKAISILP
ncbi:MULTISPECIES: hemerythrin domain-containing protein [Nocardioides]|uniref:Hemerythrin domain-containing protein n=1 Tax=Nocardioides vastitatis TaxID=2568655 RepID=A0ABW0ZGG8_9ACTN|nr:hemerythrin domain-containing protein [Nocardioides sp.]THI97925.1 hemerythrin domain-containing protein [Nocardioides sp.]